jgi:hypothetical protein
MSVYTIPWEYEDEHNRHFSFVFPSKSPWPDDRHTPVHLTRGLGFRVWDDVDWIEGVMTLSTTNASVLSPVHIIKNVSERLFRNIVSRKGNFLISFFSDFWRQGKGSMEPDTDDTTMIVHIEEFVLSMDDDTEFRSRFEWIFPLFTLKYSIFPINLAGAKIKGGYLSDTPRIMRLETLFGPRDLDRHVLTH